MIDSRNSNRRPLLLVVALSLGLDGCGRPATEADCLEILRRAARLELGARVGANRELMDAEVLAIENSMREAMMKQCVGKRITEGALACVRSAKSSEELFDQCLR